MKRTITFFIMIIALATAISVGLVLGSYWAKSYNAANEFDKMEKVKVSKGVEDVWAKNHDTWAWVKIKNTKLSYPVMHTPKDPQYYLRRNFEKKYSLHGTPFLDGSTSINESFNYMIYGHHMGDGSMFATLLKYTEAGFYKKHKKVSLDIVRHGKHKYKIFAYGSVSNHNKIYTLYNVIDKEDYNEFVDAIENSLYIVDDIPDFGTQFVTLSTCEAAVGDYGKFVVVAGEVNE